MARTSSSPAAQEAGDESPPRRRSVQYDSGKYENPGRPWSAPNSHQRSGTRKEMPLVGAYSVNGLTRPLWIIRPSKPSLAK